MQVRLREMTESRIFGGLVMSAIALSSAALAMARPSMGEVEFVSLPAYATFQSDAFFDSLLWLSSFPGLFPFLLRSVALHSPIYPSLHNSSPRHKISNRRRSSC